MIERVGEQVALTVLAAEGAQYVALFHCLDALGDDIHTEALGQRNDGAHDVLVAAAFPEGIHEGAVDLQSIGGEAQQIAQRRVPSSRLVPFWAALLAYLMMSFSTIRTMAAQASVRARKRRSEDADEADSRPKFRR